MTLCFRATAASYTAEVLRSPEQFAEGLSWVELDNASVIDATIFEASACAFFAYSLQV